jgi:hypothetical protein
MGLALFRHWSDDILAESAETLRRERRDELLKIRLIDLALFRHVSDDILAECAEAILLFWTHDLPVYSFNCHYCIEVYQVS